MSDTFQPCPNPQAAPAPDDVSSPGKKIEENNSPSMNNGEEEEERARQQKEVEARMQKEKENEILNAIKGAQDVFKRKNEMKRNSGVKSSVLFMPVYEYNGQHPVLPYRNDQYRIDVLRTKDVLPEIITTLANTIITNVNLEDNEFMKSLSKLMVKNATTQKVQEKIATFSLQNFERLMLFNLYELQHGIEPSMNFINQIIQEFFTSSEFYDVCKKQNLDQYYEFIKSLHKLVDAITGHNRRLSLIRFHASIIINFFHMLKTNIDMINKAADITEQNPQIIKFESMIKNLIKPTIHSITFNPF